MAKLDETDLKILAALTLNPKSSYEDVAYVTEVPVEEVEKRVRRMMDEGVILNYGLKLREDVLTMLPPRESLKEFERKIVLKARDIIGLVSEVNRVFGTGSGIILNYAGIGIGQSIANEKTFSGKEDAFKALEKALEDRGFGEVSIEFTDFDTLSGKIIFNGLSFPKENPLHEVFEMLVRGIFQGFVGKVFKANKVSLTKDLCIAKGGDSCIFSFRIEG
ncbi:MAG: Lrp/AsnC family transcriptional regulator [Thermoproteota archaeon]